MAASRARQLTCKVVILFFIVMEITGKQLAENSDVKDKTFQKNSQSIRLPESCRPEFRTLPNHTMCLFDSPDVVDAGISRVTRNYIIDEHNRIRGSVIPPAIDLTYLVWDNRLGELAEKWARQCQQLSDDSRQLPNYGATIGQNGAWGYRRWKDTLAAWSSEAEIYRFGQEPESYLPAGQTWQDIGHYTQMVYNTTVRIGCGFAKCREVGGQQYTNYYFCNYAAGQSYRQAFPYTSGSRCSACPGSCVKGVCMCGGRICVNGGRLNLATCSCECPSLYSGKNCKKVVCPPKDAVFCGREWQPHMCQLFANVPEKCPFMCGICPVPVEEGRHDRTPDTSSADTSSADTKSTDTSSADPQEYVSDFGCKYTGKRPSPDECLKLGNSGRDSDVCESQGGSERCKDCYNLPETRQACPVMCGICPDRQKTTSPAPRESSTGADTTQGQLPETCDEEFRDIPGHTMCLHDNPDVIESGVTASDIDVIIRAHNRIRGRVDPPATDLPNLVWDSELARVAGKWARQCNNYHDKVRNIPSYGLAIGQNAAWGAVNWKKAINVWYEEVKKYRFGVNPDEYLPEGYLEIGHYTQLVYNTTVRVGCGFAKCRISKYVEVPFYFCNYAPGQGLRSDYPYINGTQCSACPDNCRKGLCQCGGKLCRNHGTLNVTTCECECQPVYGGEECEQVFCPPEDAWFCGSSWLESACSQYANAPSLCPYLCGLCPVNESDANITKTTHMTSTELAPELTSSMPDIYTEITESTQTSLITTDSTALTTTVTQITSTRTEATVLTDETTPVTQTTAEGKTTATTTATTATIPVPTSPQTASTVAVTEATSAGSVAPPEPPSGTATPLTTPGVQENMSPSKTSLPHSTSSTLTVSSSDQEMSPTATTQTTTQKATTTTQTTTQKATTTTQTTTQKATTTTQRTVTICLFSGEKHDSDTCLGFGNWGQDREDCLSRGGPWGCDQCAADPEFAKGFCPVMCGICDPQCDGVMCEHGGTLNIDECTCICPRHFTGDRCQIDARTTVLTHAPEVTTTTTKQTTPSTITTTERWVTICPYAGEKHDSDTCLGFGNWGQDRGDCLSRGGPWGCDQCAADPEFARGFCPVMCGICDPQCDGLMCEHGGTLNIDECTCICPRHFTGDRCQTDSRTIVSSGVPEVTTTTTQATTPKTTTTTEREVTICAYAGEKHDIDTCLGFGNWGQDRGDCSSRGGPWGCDQCSADPEFARSFCPVMCGICDPQCEGLMCEHGGTLNIDECKCICPRYFTGDRCQTANCPNLDPWYCGVHPPQEYCHVEPFRQTTIQQCPHMCGIC